MKAKLKASLRRLYDSTTSTGLLRLAHVFRPRPSAIAQWFGQFEKGSLDRDNAFTAGVTSSPKAANALISFLQARVAARKTLDRARPELSHNVGEALVDVGVAVENARCKLWAAAAGPCCHAQNWEC